MCVLYELGLFFARFVIKKKEEADTDYLPPNDAQLDAELDVIDNKK